MHTDPVTVSLAIKAEPEQVWAALIDGATSPAYANMVGPFGGITAATGKA